MSNKSKIVELEEALSDLQEQFNSLTREEIEESSFMSDEGQDFIGEIMEGHTLIQATIMKEYI